MANIQSHIDDNLREMTDLATDPNADKDAKTEALKTLKVLAEVRQMLPQPEPDPAPVPVTKWDRFKAGLASVWDNETTRVLIKSGGALSGVGLVVYSTIYKDHVMQREAIAQANQRNS